MSEIYNFNRTIFGISYFGKESDLLKIPFYNVHGHIKDVTSCKYCGDKTNKYGMELAIKEFFHMYICICFNCHWWRKMVRDYDNQREVEEVCIMGKHGISEDDVPIAELRSFLIKNWEQRKSISAKKCEQVVSTIFKNYYNCDIHYSTNSVYTKDGGIDLILIENENGIRSGIQVKRRQTNKPESVKCIREFIGSIAQSPFQNGFFVTTANNFTRDALIEYSDSKENLAKRNIGLTLIDGNKLLKMMNNCKLKTLGSIRLEELLKNYNGELWEINNNTIRIILKDEILNNFR